MGRALKKMKKGDILSIRIPNDIDDETLEWINSIKKNRSKAILTELIKIANNKYISKEDMLDYVLKILPNINHQAIINNLEASPNNFTQNSTQQKTKNKVKVNTVQTSAMPDINEKNKEVKEVIDDKPSAHKQNKTINSKKDTLDTPIEVKPKSPAPKKEEINLNKGYKSSFKDLSLIDLSDNPNVRSFLEKGLKK